MRVGDILNRKSTRIATVRMNETVATAARLLRDENISALVVKDVVRTEGNTAAGMFTERDVVRAVAQHGAAGINMRVSQFISDQVKRWDLGQLTRLVELNIGRDLQYIRFNGMIIGGLAGLALHVLERLFLAG